MTVKDDGNDENAGAVFAPFVLNIKPVKHYV
jgi:hypothetical protein